MSTFGDDTVARNLQYFMEQLQMAEETVTALTALRPRLLLSHGVGRSR